MSKYAIEVKDLSKQYRLGEIGTGSITHDLNRWFHKLRGLEDPYAMVGEVNKRDAAVDSDYVWAIKDVNFKVEKGDVVGVIGKNGAGKSTLLKILSKVTGPSTGEIKMEGRVASLLEVGTGFHQELTGRENIYLNGAILGMTKNEIKLKIDEIIEFAGILKYVDTPVKRYSSGMKVRLGFAVAAYLEPEILIVDEVLAVGDVEFQKRAIGKMQDITKNGGRTVLFVSHNLSSIEQLCSKSILMQDGMLVAYDDTEEVIKQYISVNYGGGDDPAEHQDEVVENPYFMLTNYRILDGNGKEINAPVSAENDSIYVEIEGDLKVDINGLSIGFILKDEMENVYINNRHIDMLEEDTLNLKKGHIKLKAKVDISYLNSGDYYFHYAVGVVGAKGIQKDNGGVWRKLTIFGQRERSTKSKAKRKSLISPYIKWENV
jgi:lipopolysaccharide transport system ATP-binding protein